MTSAHENHVEFRGTLGKFILEAAFTVPATGITMLWPVGLRQDDGPAVHRRADPH